MITIDPRRHKPCPMCRGIGKRNDLKCESCGGYGSVSTKIIMQGLRRTNEGALRRSRGETFWRWDT